MSKLKRLGIGAGITTVALTCLMGFWYKSHYSLPVIIEGKYAIPHPNGFDTLQDAIKLTVLEQDGIAVSPKALSYNPIRYPNQPLAGRMKLMEANQASIAKTREALAQAYRNPPHPNTESLGRHLRDQARMLVFAGQANAEAGNPKEAARYYLDAIELGVAIPHGGRVLPLLFGHFCETMGTTALSELVENLDAETALAAADRIAKIEQERTPFPEVLYWENHGLYHEMATLFAGSPITTWKNVGTTYSSMSAFTSFVVGAEEETQPPPLEDKVRVALLQVIVTYQGPGPTIQELDRWISALTEQSKQPWGPQRPPLKEPAGNLIAQLIGPMFSQTEFYDLQARANMALLQTRLRLHAGFLETGRYPATLENLPIDPFSPARSPLSYRSDGKTYTLWSVGPDAKDDNGTPPSSSGKDTKRKPRINVTSQGDIVA